MITQEFDLNSLIGDSIKSVQKANSILKINTVNTIRKKRRYVMTKGKKEVDTAETHSANVVQEAVDTVIQTSSEAVAQEVSEVSTTPPVTEAMCTLYDYVMKHTDKLQNSAVFNLDITGIRAGKYLLFRTKDPQSTDLLDASLIMFEFPNQLWLNDVVPTSIRVENSGLVIESENYRFYAGKTNIIRFHLTNGKVMIMDSISKAKTADKIKISAAERNETTTEKAIDEVKLHVKSISPRLYNLVKDIDDKTIMKTKVNEFMSKVSDINHLIKIDRDLLLSCQL